MIRSNEMNGMSAPMSASCPDFAESSEREEDHAGSVAVGDDVLHEVVRFTVGTPGTRPCSCRPC